MATRVLPEGFTVEFQHQRYYDQSGQIQAKGGVTLASIFDSDGVIVAQALAACSPHDNFNKRIGRDISLGRALKKLYDWRPDLASNQTVSR
jgi:hypothetical protein